MRALLTNPRVLGNQGRLWSFAVFCPKFGKRGVKSLSMPGLPAERTFRPSYFPTWQVAGPHHQASLHIFAKVSLRSRHLEVVSTKENGCARRRHACFPGVRPFSLSPTTSKHLLRRPAKVVADSFHNLVYRAATKTCYEDKLLFRNVYFVATGEKCRKLALKSCIIKSIILPTQHNFEHKTSVSWATRSIICQILLKTEYWQFPS